MFPLPTPFCWADFIFVMGTCVSPMLCGGCVDCLDLPATGSNVCLGAGCQLWNCLNVSQALNLLFVTQSLISCHSVILDIEFKIIKKNNYYYYYIIFIGFLLFSRQEFKCFHSLKIQNCFFTLTQERTLKVRF